MTSSPTTTYRWLHDQGAIAVIDYNRRNEHLDEASLLNQGYDQYGTPYAPCGRLCHSNGYDYQAQSGSMSAACNTRPRSNSTAHTATASSGYYHPMSFNNHPRLIGPMQRGSKAWQRLYGTRSASERTKSYDQEVVANAHPLRMRGLQSLLLCRRHPNLAPTLALGAELRARCHI